MSEQLFDMPADPLPDWRDPSLSSTRRITVKNNALIAQGFHPLTHRSLLTTGETCGGCRFAEVVNGGRRSYWKCGKAERTRGPGSDLRKKWPACELFRPAEVSA